MNAAAAEAIGAGISTAESGNGVIVATVPGAEMGGQVPPCTRHATDLARALAFALDVVLPVEERPSKVCGGAMYGDYCNECECRTNHTGAQHRAAEARMEREP